MHYARLLRDGTCAVNYGKHTYFQWRRGACVPFYWPPVICSLLSALPHAVPMVPGAFIGHCKVWDRTPFCAQHPRRYRLSAPVRQLRRDSAPRPLGRRAGADWLL